MDRAISSGGPRGHPMTRRSSIAWLILVMVTPFPATESSVGASGVAELCFGQVPTIVGAVGEDITGTDGPDVVLSNGGAYQIDTGKGADLVCVVGVPADRSHGLHHDGAGPRSR